MSMRRWTTVLAILGGLLTGGALAAAPASADVTWLCRPGESPDPCVGDLTTTFQAEGGVVRTPAVDPAPPVDCFYVYPTVSEQPGLNAEKVKEPSVVAIATFQAQQYSRHCRMFAPVYRQRTLAGIGATATSAEDSARSSAIAYGDVLEAFRQYLAQDSAGRGFVLVGHSQGSYLLRRLVRDVIDQDPALRARLVSAILLGGNVVVPRGRDVGGDFQAIPACRSTTQLACVVAFSTFGDPVPDPSRFGRVPQDQDLLSPGSPVGDQYQVLCTNPADLAGNRRSPLGTLAPSGAFPGTLGLGLRVLYGGPQPTADTPWLSPAEQYTGACEDAGGANVLQLQPIGSARKLNPSPDATWGLHLVDANIAQEQLVDLVGTQGAAYAAATAPVSAAPVAPAAPAVPVTPTLTVRIRPTAGRRVATTVTLGATQGRRCDGRVRVTLYLAGGKRLSRRTVTLTGCTTSPTVRLAQRRVGRRISAKVAYLGGSALRPAAGATGTVSVRR